MSRLILAAEENHKPQFGVFKAGSDSKVSRHVTDEQLERFLKTSSAKEDFKELELRQLTSLSEKGFLDLLSHPKFSKLEVLTIHDCDCVSDAVLSAIMTSNLKRLALKSLKFITPAGYIKLFKDSSLSNLERLELRSAYTVNDEVLSAFSQSQVPKLTRLDLRKCDKLTLNGLKVLGESPILPRITHLNISGCYKVNGDDLKEFLNPTYLRSLRNLKMKNLTGVRDPDVEWIINSEVGKQLKTLSFKNCRFSDLTYQTLLKAKMNCLTKLTIPITSWYLEEILNSPMMSQITFLEIYDIRGLIDYNIFRDNKEEYSKFDVISKRVDDILSNSKQLTNLTKLKLPSACTLSKFWKSENCLKLSALDFNESDSTKTKKKKTVKKYVSMPPAETTNQILHAETNLLIPSGADYILGKDLGHVESLFIEDIQDVYHLATARFQQLKTLTISLKHDHGIERFAEVDMRPAKLTRLKIHGIYSWTFFTDVLPLSKNFTFLQSIKIGVVGISGNYIEAFKNLRSLKFLKKITFSQGSISVSALSAIIANVPELEEISLRDCTLEEEVEPNVEELIDFKGLIKTHREHFFQNIYLQPCTFRLLVKNRFSGGYSDERTQVLPLSKIKEKPYGNFPIILAENPAWNNEGDGGYDKLMRTLYKFQEYYKKDGRNLNWIKTLDTKNSSLDNMVFRVILDKCIAMKSLRYCNGGVNALSAFPEALESLQSLTVRFLPELDDIKLFGPFLSTIFIYTDRSKPFAALKTLFEAMTTNEKSKYINSFILWEFGNSAGREICPFGEVMNFVTSTPIKDFRYFEVPNYKFDFTPENKQALKTILTQLTTLKYNQTLLLSLLAKFLSLFEKHLQTYKEDDDKDALVVEYFAQIFRDSADIAEIICFYAINYKENWLRRAIMKITASMPMTPEELKKLYIREIWDVTFTEISFLKDESEIHNPLAIEYAFKDFQTRPDDKIVLRIIDKVFTNLTAEQLKALPKTAEHASIFRHPLFYDPNHPWTFAEYSLKFRDLDSFLGKHSQSIPTGKKIILWEKVKGRFVDDHFNQVDFSRVKELAIKFPRISRDIFQRVESFDLKTITIQVEMGNEREYNIPKKAISKAMYQKLERINIEIYNLTHVSAEPWAWFVDILDNIKSECTLDISIENNGKVVVPLEIQERSSLKVKTLILQGKASFNFFSELHTRMKMQTIECQEIKIKRRPLDNWDEEKTDENEKKILAYIGKMKGTLNHIRLDIPLKLNSLINILQTPQWLQIKNFRIMSSGTNEELELIARAKNLSRLKTLHIDFSQRITHGESLTLYLQGIKALLSGARGSLKSLDWGRFFSVHSRYGLICHEIIKEAIKRNIFKEPSFQQWTLETPHHKYAILPETVTKVLENTDIKNFDIVQFIAQNKGHPAITPRVYCYYVTGQFRDKILSLCAGTTPIIFQDKKSQTHTSLIDLLNTNHFTQAHLDDMIETQPLSIDDDFISIMCTFADVIMKHQIVIRKLDKKHKSITSTGLNQLIKTFPYPEFPSLYKWVVGSTYYLQMADLDNLEMLSTRDIKFFDIKKLRLSSHKFLSPYSEMEMEASEIIAQRDASNLMGHHHAALTDNAKNRRDTAILGLICQCQSLQWLHLDNLNLDDVFCTRLAVLHNEKLKNKNKLQLISIKENPYITYVGLKFLYSMPIADEAFQQSHYGIIANCEVILDIPEVVVLNDGIHAAVKSKFREYKRKKKARGLRYFDNACIPLIIYSIVCFPFAFFQYFDDEINETKYLRKIRNFVTKIGDKVRGLLNMQLKKAEYEYFDDMEDEQDKASGSRLQYIFSKGCIKLNAFFRRRYVWALLYGIHAVLYYFFAIFFPLKFVHECNSTEKNYSHIAYGIYAGIATVSEALLLRKSIKTINNDQVAQFKWVAILVPLAISQNNKLSLYTDVLYLTTAFSCGSHTKGLISAISIGIFLFMNAVQIFNLLEEYIKIRRNSRTHNSTYIDAIAKFCYSVDLTSISSFLEKISICCADQVGRTYVPQILQTIGLKCMTVTFPQAILQLSSYLASDLSKSSMIYLVSFVVSIVNLILAFYSLITAQPSACTPATVKKVFYKDFATQLKQVERAPTKKKPKKISAKVVDAGTLTAKQDKKMRLFECFNSLKFKIASLFTRKEAKVCETELTTVKDAAKMARLVRYEQEVAKLKAKYNRKGKVSGYYVQGGECPIEGTYCLVDGVLDMRTKDTVGIAKWDGVISIFTGVARIAKRYDGNHFVGYNGDINWDNEADVEVNGLWSIGGSGDRFKLTFYREDEIEKKLDAEPAKPDEPAESDVPEDQAEESSLIEGEEGDYEEEDPEENY